MADELFTAPADLTLITDDDELRNLEAKAVAEFDRVDGTSDVDPDALAYAMRVKDDIKRIRSELRVRELRAQEQATMQQSQVARQLADLRADVHGDGTGNQPPAGQATAEIDTQAIAAAAAQGATQAFASMMMDRRSGSVRPEEIARRATASLAETAQHQPASRAPEKRLAVTASVDIPGVAHGDSVTSLRSLADVTSRKAKSVPVTQNNPNYQLIASVRNEYDHSLDDRNSVADVGELVRHMTSRDKQQALVAGGGWCAPSEIRYDFFNISCADGMIDLPTVGITRGGIRFPVSPSLASTSIANAFGGFAVPFGNSSNPWLWTEADDEATVTGSPNKPCVRVPCPTFEEEKLECYGICLTAGNLTDDAYPEATEHMLQLLMDAHAHAMNARLLALMVADANVAVTAGEYANANVPVFQQVLGGIDLGATDYRSRFGMCLDDVLEVVAPYWLRNVIRADLAWRNGVDMLSVTDGMITQFFVDRNLRVQWVDDWQVRGASQFGNASTPMTAWPTSAQVMIYAAGTYIHGQGMSLDLGIVRDSVLNAENDHTAAWSEECHLIARVGPESRLYTINFNVMGTTTVADIALETHAFPNL